MPIDIPDLDHREFANPSTWIPLFEIDISPQYFRFTPNPVEVVIGDNTYKPFPVQINEIRDDGKGEVAEVTLTVSNVAGLVSTAIRNAGYIDGNDIVFSIYSVEKAEVVYSDTLEIISVGPITDEAVTIQVGMFNPFMISLLQQKFVRDFCWNTFQGEGCWIKQSDGTYAAPTGFTNSGSGTFCKHTIEDCEHSHNNVLRANLFPGIPDNMWMGTV